jgi:K+ transporter
VESSWSRFFNSTPVWAASAYGVAVTAGVLASLFLLLRKTWAVPLFTLSLVGIILQNLHAFVFSNGLEAWGTEGSVALIANADDGNR